MSGAKKMVPKRRFKEFFNAGDWEQCKLGDLLILLKDGSHGTHKNTSEGVYLLSAKNIKNGRINIMPDDRIISWDDYNVIHKNYELQIGDILLTIVGSIGETAIYNLKMKVTFQRSVAFLRPNSKLKNGFLYTLINTDRFQNQLQTKQVVSAQPGIYLGDLASINITYPKNVSEQEKIYNIFKGIEDSITLHQRKIDKLQATKKALLQEMFPEEGQDKPKRRFKGFTDAWEQRKFLDLLDAQNGIRRGPFGSSLKKDSFVKKSDYVVYEQQNAIYDNYETRYFISKEKYNELIRFNIQPGDFIMSGAGTIGRISMVPDGIKKGVFNQALIRFKVNKDSINPLYFLKFMQSDMMQKQLTQANPGSAMTNLVPMDELKKWDVTIPSLEEQNRISTFINQIDAFITLHQRKLDKLKNLKQAYLNEMFV